VGIEKKSEKGENSIVCHSLSLSLFHFARNSSHNRVAKFKKINEKVMFGHLNYQKMSNLQK